MNEPPTVPEYSEAELFEELQARAATYTDWDPESEDAARTLLRIYARFGSDLFDRLSDAPAKHRLAFLDAMGTSRQPPTPARMPVTVDVAETADAVTVPEGTRVLAEASSEPETVAFEVETGFQATSASLTDVVAVDPDEQRIVDHGELLDGDAVRLFEGENCRDPALYLGDDLLSLEAGSEFVLEATGAGSIFEAPTEWEYYGVEEADTGGWHRLDRLESDAGRARFRMPGEPIQQSIDGVDTCWVRCRPGEAEPRLTLGSVSLQRSPDGSEPDALVANDVPLSTDGEQFRPFGRLAQPPATWYVAAEAAFTTAGGTAEIRLEPPVDDCSESDTGTKADEDVPGTAEASDTEEGAPDVDEEAARSEPAAHESSEPAVFGGPPVISWEYYNGSGWTRIEGVEDDTDALRDSGAVRFPVPGDLTSTTVAGQEQPWIRARLVSGRYGQRGRDSDRAPRFGDVIVSHEHDPRSVSTVCRRADATFQTVDFDAGTVDPFPPITAEHGTAYFGFDEALSGGPLTLFVAVDGTVPSFDPGLRWEYWSTTTENWQPIDADDGTQGLTEKGIVELSIPEETTARGRFGRERHWVRARVTGSNFPGESNEEGSDGRSPPLIEAIYTNGGWAVDTETITETIGTSDGTPGQSFSCSRRPVLDPTVHVEESNALSGEQRQRLRSDRHYTVDATAGTITLDGQQDAILPDGEVRATYTTGGGARGDVDTGAVTELDDRLPGVEAVTNPAPATGGTDAETTDELADRAADRFRHRGRAVSPADYERIAAAAVREVGAVTCLPAGDRTDDVTVVLAPASGAARPVPSASLRERITGTLQARAPARVAAGDRITVRGPTYVPIDVDVTVLSRDPSVGRRVAERLETLLHPTAGNGGEGWPFGSTPDIETVETAVADVGGVESVSDIDARLGGDELRPLGERTVAPDALICSGDHRVNVDPAIGGETDPTPRKSEGGR